MRASLHIAALLVFSAIVPAWGDLVVLDDGASLSGNLVRVTDSTLVFRTTLEGQIMAPLDAVRGISTRNNLAITLANDTALYGRLQYRDRRQQVVPIGGGDPQSIRLSEVVEAAVIPATDNLEETDIKAWRASLGLGLRHGEYDNTVTQPQARLQFDVDRPRTGLRVDLRAAGGGDGEPALRGAVEVEGRGGGLAPFGALDYEYDPERGLDLRTGLTLGLTKPFVDDDRGTLRGMVGLSLVREFWDNQAVVDNRPSTEHDTDVDLRLRLSYARPISEAWRLRGALDVLPSLTDWGQLRMRSETEVLYAVAPRLYLRFGLLLDFDSQPDVTGPDRLGASVGAGVRMDF